MRASDFSNITTPDDYAEASVLTQTVAKELFARLEIMKIQPELVLDLGCGLGGDLEDLARAYPQAHILGMDLAQDFLRYGKNRVVNNNIHWLKADAGILPLRSDSVDLIFANMLLPWVENYAAMLAEWRRVLRPQGLVLFSSLGPDTFQECSGDRIDMHHIGDALVEQGFADPVLEVENFTLSYSNLPALQAEMAKSGLCLQASEHSPEPEGGFALNFEVIYGHAWCPGAKAFKSDEQGIVRIPVSGLRK